MEIKPMEERIVITGMGAVTPLGLTVAESWRNVVNGVSGVGKITLFDSSNLPVHIACGVKGFVPEKYMHPRETRRRDRVQQLATAAAQEAIQQAGIESTPENSGRIGVVVASSIGGLRSLQDSILTMVNEGPRKISPFAIPMLMSNGPASLIALDHHYQGPCFSLASACASSADAIGMACLMLRAGIIDVAVTGGCEATITQIGIAAFDRLGAMSRCNDDYSMTPQPFDLNRDGLVMGEGAAVMVLEREEFARQRGAEILAELAGYAATSDAFHITAPAEDGEGGARAMRQAMDQARVTPEQIDYINAHGTATQLNDQAETRAIKNACGNFAYNIPVSSTKSVTGHMMGTTGAVEAIFCVQAIRESIIPPTMHYQTRDPQCDLDYVPNQARSKEVRVAMSNAFGFGGHNAVLILKHFTN
jgi:3-oxoacyl-[acyl-carrier-protein] synthase II